MRKHRISDAEAELLLAGKTPQGRPELAGLATSVEQFRTASFDTVPQPSASLAARFGVTQAPEISSVEVGSGVESAVKAWADGEARRAEPATAPAQTKGLQHMFEWIAGLGLITKISVAAGALVLGTAGVGAAGALPSGAQDVFDNVVSVVTNTEITDDTTITDDDIDLDDDSVTGIDDDSDLNDDGDDSDDDSESDDDSDEDTDEDSDDEGDDSDSDDSDSDDNSGSESGSDSDDSADSDDSDDSDNSGSGSDDDSSDEED